MVPTRSGWAERRGSPRGLHCPRCQEPGVACDQGYWPPGLPKKVPVARVQKSWRLAVLDSRDWGCGGELTCSSGPSQLMLP